MIDVLVEWNPNDLRRRAVIVWQTDDEIASPSFRERSYLPNKYRLVIICIGGQI